MPVVLERVTQHGCVYNCFLVTCWGEQHFLSRAEVERGFLLLYLTCALESGAPRRVSSAAISQCTSRRVTLQRNQPLLHAWLQDVVCDRESNPRSLICSFVHDWHLTKWVGRERNGVITQSHVYYIFRVGQNHIYIYIRCIYGIYGRDITRFTVIYGVYMYTVLVNPTYIWRKKSQVLKHSFTAKEYMRSMRFFSRPLISSLPGNSQRTFICNM
jgi:hypothetical protein